jgi:transposase
MLTHQPYPSDVSDAEWEFVAPYLCLLPEDAGERVQEVTGESVEIAFVDQGYTGDDADGDAASRGSYLVVRLPEAK